MAESEADPAESVNRRVPVGCPKVQDPSHTPVEFRRLHSRSPFSAESTFISDEELDQIVSMRRLSRAGKVPTSVVHEAGLREILKQIDD
jgi:hypothetical protein